MQLPWRRKQTMLDAASQIQSHSKSSKSIVNVPERDLEDAPAPRPKQKAYDTWIDQMISEHEKDGGFNDLEGKGKPLDLDESGGEYIVNKIMKNANILPPWLELQHEIRDEIQRLLSAIQKQSEKDFTPHIQRINQKISRYNSIVPSPLFYKPLIRLESIDEQSSSWE